MADKHEVTAHLLVTELQSKLKCPLKVLLLPSLWLDVKPQTATADHSKPYNLSLVPKKRQIEDCPFEL